MSTQSYIQYVQHTHTHTRMYLVLQSRRYGALSSCAWNGIRSLLHEVSAQHRLHSDQLYVTNPQASTCTYVNTYVRTYTARTYIRTYLCNYVCAYIRTYMYVYSTYVCAYVCTNICTYIHKYVYTVHTVCIYVHVRT